MNRARKIARATANLKAERTRAKAEQARRREANKKAARHGR